MNDLTACNSTMAFLAPSATLAISAKAKAMKAAGEDVCSMGAGEPDFDTPAHIKQAAIEALLRGETKYTPASGIPELKKAIAEKFERDNHFKVDPSRITISPGAKFSGFAAIVSLCGIGDEVILPAPYWVSYPEMIKAAGAKAVIVPCLAENGYELDPADFEKAITPRTKLLILNSPSNPTGAVWRRSTIEKIAEIALKNNIMVMSDEIYEELVYDADAKHTSIASLSPEMLEHTVTINGLSKAYAMPGWRLGYLAAPAWLSKRINAFQSHTTANPTSFVQFGAIAALNGPQDEVVSMRNAFAKRRDLIYSLASSIEGIKAVRPQGAFYLFLDISSFGLASADFVAKLLDQEKLAAVPGDAFGDDRCIRLSYACSEELIRKSLDRLASFCASLKK